ncbi:unnamed protein product [Taenia asiatica]|uniref:Serine/threonine-protein kinase TOR n=1 Tax=Taenia asiatica TaxID=60517 RepID=A0A158R7X3_TAEAS|nr:unnamed protein product [Taenia asiatica]
MSEALHQRILVDIFGVIDICFQHKLLFQECHLMSTEDKFMQILHNYAESSVEEKRFLIVNCDAIYQDRDGSEWQLSLLNTMVEILEQIDLSSTSSHHKLPDVPSDNSSGRSPWTFTPHSAQYISYIMSRLLTSKPVDVRSRNLIHKVILKLFRKASGAQVKAALLRFSKYFARFLTAAEVKDLILPLVPLCLNSRRLELLAAAMEALPKLVEYSISTEIYEKCLQKAVNAFRKSASRPQIQSVAIQCIANILLQLPLDTVENVLLPFALECTVDAVNSDNVRVCGGEGSEKITCHTISFPAQDISCLIPSYLIEFDFFLSQGEPVISLCCLLKTILRERRTILSPSMIAMEILPCLLPHTLNKQWKFSEFKYIMSTLYEYLNYLNETKPHPSNNDCSLHSSQKEEIKLHDQAIKVRIDHGSLCEEGEFRGSSGHPSASRCIQRRGSGNIILPLISASSECAAPESRLQFTLDDDTKNNSDSKDDNFHLTPNRITSASNVASNEGIKNSSSTQHLLLGENLLTVAVCEGPFCLPDKNRRRSAIDLRSATEVLSASPLLASTQQMLLQTPNDSPKKAAVCEYTSSTQLLG